MFILSLVCKIFIKQIFQNDVNLTKTTTVLELLLIFETRAKDSLSDIDEIFIRFFDLS